MTLLLQGLPGSRRAIYYLDQCRMLVTSREVPPLTPVVAVSSLLGMNLDGHQAGKCLLDEQECLDAVNLYCI